MAGPQNPATIDGAKYPIAVDAEGHLRWNVVDIAAEAPEVWDEWIEMGHPRRFGRGYLQAEGFDATSGVLRLSPFYHALNNNQLSTGVGYFFDVQGPATTPGFDAASNGTASEGIITFSHVVSSGDDRALVVHVSLPSSQTVSGVTYDGVPLTWRGNGGSSTYRVSIWILLSPPVGTANVVATMSGLADAVAGATSWTNINQTDPTGSIASATATSTAPTVDVPSVAGEIVHDVLCTADVTATVHASQTERWNAVQETGGVPGPRGAGSTEAGAASVMMSWTLGSSAEWVIAAFALKPATTQFVYCLDGDKIFKNQYDSTEGITEVVAVSGTADSATASTLVDAAPAWTDDLYNDNLIEITGGLGAGQRRRIVDTVDAGDRLDIADDWDITPDATSTYRIYGSVHVASGAAGRPVYANGKWYVPMGAGANVRRLDAVGLTTDTWVDAGFTALHMSTYQVGPNAGFARAHSTNKVDITFDTGNLSDFSGDDFPVGDTSTAITDLNEAQGELIVSKEDSAYTFDLEGTSKPISTFKNRAFTDPENGKGTKVWLSRAFIPSNQGLDRYVIGERILGVGINRIVGFGQTPAQITTPRTRRHAFVEAVGHNIYVQANGGELTGLMHARHREEGDPIGGELVWNQVLEIPLSKGMLVDSQNHLWLKGASTFESTRDIRVIELDDNGGLDKPLRRGQADSEHFFYFDEADWESPFAEKQARHIAIELSNWDSNATLQVQVYRDDNSALVDVGATMNADGVYERSWTVGDKDRLTRGRVRLKVTTGATYTPQSKDPTILRLRWVIRSPSIVKAVVDASSDAGLPEGKTAKDVFEDLTRLQDRGEVVVLEPGQLSSGIDPDDPDSTTGVPPVSDAIAFNAEIFRVVDTRFPSGPDGEVGYGIEVWMKRWVIA